jgi:hypothetical protein
MPSIPFDQQARLPDAPSPSQDGQSSVTTPTQAVQAFHFLAAADEFHGGQ